MRAAALSSNSQESETLPQDAFTRGPYRGADDGQCEEALAAEIADVLDRKMRARRQASLRNLRPRRTSRDDISCGNGFVWYSQPFVEDGCELPRASRLVFHAWLEKAKRERRRARARRTVSLLLVLAIGVGALAVTGTQDSLKALQFIGIEVTQLLNTAPL